MSQTFNNIGHSRFALAALCIICIAAGIWLTVGEFFLIQTQHMAFDVGVNQAHLTPIPSPVCPAPTTCPETSSIQRLSQSLFPPQEFESESPWMLENHKQLQALFRCLEESNCGPNQAKVVILGSYHFRGARLDWNGGEDIWARSTINALRNLGFTFIHSLSMDRTVQLYQMFPHLVKAIMVEDTETYECFKNTEDCLLSELNPDGIPAWKIFSFYFWPQANHPLGGQWVMNPEDYTLENKDWSKNTYIGYSVEDACRTRKFIPHTERKRQAYVMTKIFSSFSPSPDLAWPPDFYEAATNATGIQFMVGAKDDSDATGKPAPPLPAGVVNHGLMPQHEFLDHVSRSEVLVGIGNPVTSPTPYDALCLGVPFLNPILRWDPANPSDSSKWDTQHVMISQLGPPYVYNVFKGDREGFVQAIRDATSTPIKSYVLGRMRMPAVQLRLDRMLHKNWKNEATALLARRQNGSEEGPLFMVEVSK